MKLVRKPTACRALKLPYPKWTTLFFQKGHFFRNSVLYVKYMYTFLITCLVLFLRKHKKSKVALVLGALLIEPFNCVRKVYDHLKGSKKNYSEYGLNPTDLSANQLKKTPILFLQGRQGNQGAFRYFASAMSKEGSLGPIFTVRLECGDLKMSDLEIIDIKIQEIQRLYKKRLISLNLVGYSRGAELALYAALPKNVFHIDDRSFCYACSKWTCWRPEIGKIIRIGSKTLLKEWEALSPKMQKSIYEVTGALDVLMPGLPYSKQSFSVESGHVGLLYSQKLIEYIIELLRG